MRIWFGGVNPRANGATGSISSTLTRTANLKYIERADPYPSELYDLETDPSEARNPVGDASYRAQHIALAKEMHSFFAKQGAPALPDWKSTTKQKLFDYKQ